MFMQDKKDTSLKKIKKQHDYFEEERTPLDEFANQKFADDIPLEDLKIEVEQEENKEKTQNTSQSERKYKSE